MRRAPNAGGAKRSWRAPNDAATGAAEDIIFDLCIQSPDEIRLDAIAAELGAAILADSLSRAHALVTRYAGCAVISIDERDIDTPRGRFSLAHEIGHLELHPDIGLVAWCQADEKRGRFYQREIDAGDFASHLLMPTPLVARSCASKTPTLQAILDLATYFRVSLTAAAQRWVELSPAPIAVASTKRGKIDWWATSATFPFRIAKGTLTDPRVLARARRIEKTGAAELVSATTWTRDTKARGAKLVEESVGARGSMMIGEALTLLRAES